MAKQRCKAFIILLLYGLDTLSALMYLADIIGDDITAHLQLGTDLTLGKAVV